MVLAHESFVLARFLRFGSTNQSCHNASDEDPCADPKKVLSEGVQRCNVFFFVFLG